MPGRSTARIAGEQAGAERRWLTVLFCDLAGSTRLSVRLDPEDLQEVVRQVLDVAAGEIEAAGGFVARYMGDGVLAYFGYPSAQEDAAERAVGAADRIRSRVRSLETAKTPHLAVRIGIASGLVVVGELMGTGTARERPVAGATPNLAARIQSCAKPGDVLVSETVSERAARRFNFEALPARRLRGFPGETPLFRLAGEHLRPAPVVPRTPLLGRAAERAWLRQRWRDAAAGRGGVVGVCGPAGIGKSRLLQSLRDDAADGRWIWAEAASTGETTPLHPFIAPVRRALAHDAMSEGGSPDPSLSSLTPLLTAHQGLASGDALSPATRRRRLLRNLRGWLLETDPDGVLGLVVEDLHWADPTTLDFLRALAPELERRRVLLVVTSREPLPPDLVTPGRRLDLDRLPDEDIADLVRGLASARLDEAAIRRLVSRADGVPLFAEELARDAQQGGASATSDVPARLTDLLAARLDRLGELKPLVRAVAILGPEGPRELLATCAGLEPGACEAQVDQLVAAEVLVRRDGGGVDFRHMLLRDAAYEAVLRRERQGMHARIVEALRNRFSAFAAMRPDWLARHAAAAGDQALAAQAWGQAAARASDARAYAEAQRCYEEGLAALRVAGVQGDDPDLEMELRSGLAAALQVTRGYSAAETTKAMAAARKLARRGGDLRGQFAQLSGSWTAASSGGHYSQARRFADRALDLARMEGSATLLGLAHMMQLTARYRGGDLLGAEAVFEDGAEHFASESFRRRPGAVAQAYGNAAVNAWLLGDRRASRRRSAHGLEISLGSGNPYEAAFALYMAGMQDVLLGDVRSGRARAETALGLSDSGGFPQFAATSRLVLGRALVGLEAPAEGLQLLEAGLEQMERITQSRAGLTMYLTWRGEAFSAFGDLDGALAAYDRALAANPEEVFFRPETLRLRGETLVRLGRAGEGLTTLEAAESLAGQFGAATLRARAIRSLGQARRNSPLRTRPSRRVHR